MPDDIHPGLRETLEHYARMTKGELKACHKCNQLFVGDPAQVLCIGCGFTHNSTRTETRVCKQCGAQYVTSANMLNSYCSVKCSGRAIAINRGLRQRKRPSKGQRMMTKNKMFRSMEG